MEAAAVAEVEKLLAFWLLLPLTNFVIEAGMVGVRVISGLALVKSIAVSTVLLSDKSSALLKSVEDTVDLLETCERADPLES